MSCRCGCPGTRPCASPIAGPRSRYYRRRRSLGDAGDDSTDIDFNAYAQQIIGTALTTYANAKEAIDAAEQALKLLQAKEQAQWKAVQAGVEIYAQTLSQLVGMPILGALFNAWFSKQPGAAAGPGICATNPPKSPDWPTLKAWPDYKTWNYPLGTSSYPPGAPGSFEAYAFPILEYNFALQNNCFAAQSQPASKLFASLLQSWNATHAGPAGTRTVTGINPDCPLVGSGSNRYFDCSKAPINRWDPIALALNDAFSEKYVDPKTGFPSGNMPMNVTMTYTVNDGPQLVKHVTLMLPPKHPLASSAAASASAAAPGPSSPGSTAATVATVGLVGAAGVYVYLRGLPAFLARLLR